MSVAAGKNTISASYYYSPTGRADYTEWKETGVLTTNAAPVIIDGSLYISAIDLGKMLAPFWNYRSGYTYGNTYTSYAGIKDGLLYIRRDAIMP